MKCVDNWLAWMFEPLVRPVADALEEQAEIERETPIRRKKRKVTLKTKPSLYRPLSFKEYIGQEKAKRILSQYISAVKERKKIFPHTLIYGKPGMGKSTLAKIMAQELNVRMTELMSGSVTEFDSFKDIVKRSKNSIIFIDEVHALPRNFVENLYTVMEDFQYNSETLPKFTMLGATTELGEILKDRKPFYDRFKIIIELENYNEDELIKIAKQYKNKTFSKDKLSETAYSLIAKNCRGTPRTVIRLLDATVYFSGKLDEVLDSFGILKDGFTQTDLKTLEYLAKNDKGVGLQGLASYLDTSTENYTFVIEPFLIQQGLIARTPRGRRITLLGVEKIKELQ